MAANSSSITEKVQYDFEVLKSCKHVGDLYKRSIKSTKDYSFYLPFCDFMLVDEVLVTQLLNGLDDVPQGFFESKPENFDEGKEWLTKEWIENKNTILFSISNYLGQHHGYFGLFLENEAGHQIEVFHYLLDSFKVGEEFFNSSIKFMSNWIKETWEPQRVTMRIGADERDKISRYNKLGFHLTMAHHSSKTILLDFVQKG